MYRLGFVLSVVPKRSSSSPSRRRPRSVPSSPVRKNSNENFAVVGPNEKFADSRLYRLKQPIKDQPRFAKSQEYAILGRNEKLENNVIYPLRKPVLSNSPRVRRDLRISKGVFHMKIQGDRSTT